MSNDPLARLAEQQHWLHPIEAPLQQAVRNAFDVFGEARPTARKALHGNWLHEPLHAVLTDIPVGSWTAAVCFDALGALGGDRALDRAADAAVVLGLVSAVGAAVTGMNDWAETRGDARRVGTVHALLNIAATGLFGMSCFARRRRQTRTTARWFAAAGLVVVAASAHLGGNLVYEHGVGVQDRRTLE